MKNLTLALAFALGSFTATAQSADAQRIAISPYVASDAVASSAVQMKLQNKLANAVNANGMTSISNGSRFIITARLIENEKNVIGSAPPMISYTMDAYIYVADVLDQKSFGSIVIPLKGAGKSETKALNNVINGIRNDNPELVNLISTAKERIVGYFNENCDNIIKLAKAKADVNDYNGAIATLNSVPQECSACYDKVLTLAKPMYQKKIDRDCKMALTEAKAVWNSNQTFPAAEQASQYLLSIEPTASCYKEAQKFAEEFKREVKRLLDRDWDFAMKQFDTATDLESQRIKAIRDVGVAYGEGQPDKEVEINWLFDRR